jgi:hypothetical protein
MLVRNSFEMWLVLESRFALILPEICVTSDEVNANTEWLLPFLPQFAGWSSLQKTHTLSLFSTSV